jgi:hypothetical protein
MCRLLRALDDLELALGVGRHGTERPFPERSPLIPLFLATY